jgi:hypothetical protein
LTALAVRNPAMPGGRIDTLSCVATLTDNQQTLSQSNKKQGRVERMTRVVAP